MEIRVYKTGEDKKIDIRGTSFDHIKTVDKFKDIVFKYTSGETISIFVEGEKVVSSEYDNYKDFSGNDLGSNISDTINGLRTILLSNSEVDSYVIGDDLSQKSSETIFTHQTEGLARGFGGRLIVDDNNSKLNVTRSAGQGTSGLEVRVTGASGADIGSVVGTGAYSNLTRDFFTATASTGQHFESSFTVHGRFIAEDGIYLGTGGGSALALTDLAQVPSSLGTSGQVLAVNSGGTGLEFVSQSGGSGGSSTLIGLTDTPSGFGSTGQVLVVNAGRNALEFSTPLQLGTSSSTALAGDTMTITTSQALAINANSSKTSFPGFGTASGTALEGDTALFDGAYSSLSGIPSSFTPASHSHAQSEITGLVSALAAKANTGDLSDVALSNDYDDLSNTPTTITSSQASAITANTAKTGITSGQASAITANTAKTSFPGFGTTSGTALEGDTSLFSGAYADLTGKPSLFDGSYTSLTSVPSTFTPSSHNHSISEITSLQTTLDGLIPYSGASSNVNLNSKALTGVSSITSSAALFGSSPANLRAFNIKGTGLNGRLSLQGGSGDNPGLEMTTDSNASRVLLRMNEVGTDGTSLQIFTEPDGGGIGKHLELDDDGTLYLFPSGSGATTAGDAGFKNNSGTMQFKNSSGSWTDIPSSGGGSTNVLDGIYLEYETRDTAYSNDSYEGEVLKWGAASSMSAGQLRYMTAAGSPAASRWVNADADAASTTAGMLGIALGSSATTDGMFIKGVISFSNSFTPGDTLYVSLTAGEITNDISSYTTGDIVRIVGYAMSTGLIYFNPSDDYIELS